MELRDTEINLIEYHPQKREKILRDILQKIDLTKDIIYIFEDFIQVHNFKWFYFDLLSPSQACRAFHHTGLLGLPQSFSAKKPIPEEIRGLIILYLLASKPDKYQNLKRKTGSPSIKHMYVLISILDEIRTFLKEFNKSDIFNKIEKIVGGYETVERRAKEIFLLLEDYEEFLNKNGLFDSVSLVQSWLESKNIQPLNSTVIVDISSYLTPLELRVLEKIARISNGKVFILYPKTSNIPEGFLTPKRIQFPKKMETIYGDVVEPQQEFLRFLIPQDEADFVLREIKKKIILSKEHDHTSFLITTPFVWDYLGSLVLASKNLGLDVGIRIKKPLLKTGVGKTLMKILDTIIRGYSRKDLASIFTSSFIRGNFNEKMELDYLSRKKEIIQGLDKWENLVKESQLLHHLKVLGNSQQKEISFYSRWLSSLIDEFFNWEILDEEEVNSLLKVLSTLNEIEEFSDLLNNLQFDLKSWRDYFAYTLSLKSSEEPSNPPPEYPIQFSGFEAGFFLPHDYLFILGMSDSFPKETQLPPILPDSLRRELGLKTAKSHIEIELLRLELLLSSTKSKAYISYSFYNKGKPSIPSFVLEKKEGEFIFIPSHGTTGSMEVLSNKDRSLLKKRDFSLVETVDEFTRNFEGNISKNLGVVSLSIYPICSRRFFYREILKLERIEEPTIEITPLKQGRWLHKTLEKLINYLTGSGKPLEDLDNLLCLDHLIREFGISTLRELEISEIWLNYLIGRYEKPIKVILTDFIKLRKSYPLEETEKKIRCFLGDFMIIGQTDRIHWNHKNIIIVDYKEKLDATLEKITNFKDEKFNQLIFYGVLYAHIGYHVDDLILYGFRDKKFQKFSFVEKRLNLSKLLEKGKEILDRSLEGIKSRKFEKTTDSKICERCEFYELCWE